MDTENSAFQLLLSMVRLSPLAKLSLLSISSNHIPKLMAILCFLVSQLQLFSILLKTTLVSLSGPSLTFSEIFDFIHQFVSIGDTLDFNKYSKTSFSVFAATCLYLSFTILLFIYLNCIIYRNHLPEKFTQRIWSIMVFLHLYLLFYPIHDISLKVIGIAFSEDYAQLFPNKGAQQFVQVTSSLLFALNLLFSLMVLLCIHVPVKTKIVISSKSNIVNIIEFSLKAMCPILWALPFFESNTYKMFLLAINLAACLFRDWNFFKVLPYYNVNILRLASKINAALTLFSLVSFVFKLIGNEVFEEILVFVAITWFVLLLLIIKIYKRNLEKILHKIIMTASGDMKVDYLLHYWYAYKDYMVNIYRIDNQRKKFSEKYLFYSAALEKPIQKEEVKEEKTGPVVLNTENMDLSKKDITSLFIQYLRSSITNHSHNFLLRATLATQYMKHQQSYQTANQLIQGSLKTSSPFTKTLTLTFVWLNLIRKLKKDKIEKMTNEEKQDNENMKASGKLFNIKEYLEIHEKYQKLKDEIKLQITPQIEFWKIFQAVNAELSSLVNLTNIANTRNRNIQKLIERRRDYIDSYFFEPILILGLYLSFVQNDILGGEKLIREYERLKVGTKTNSISIDMSHKYNIFAKSLYFKVSASSKELGKILGHSRNVGKVLHIQKESLIGKSINILAPNFYLEKQNHILGVPINDNTQRSFDKPVEVQVIDNQGYIITCWMYFFLEFLPDMGLCYFILLRPIEDSTKLIVKQNGEIMHCSRGFAQEMNITQPIQSAPSIFPCCAEIRTIIDAFSYMYHQQNNMVPLKHNVSKSFDLTTESSMYFEESKNEIEKEIATNDNDLERLYQKYALGDYLIFCPIQNKKKAEVSTLTYIDPEGNTLLKPSVYLAKFQYSSCKTEMIFEINLKSLNYLTPETAFYNLDETLQAKRTAQTPLTGQETTKRRNRVYGSLIKSKSPLLKPKDDGSTFAIKLQDQLEESKDQSQGEEASPTSAKNPVPVIYQERKKKIGIIEQQGLYKTTSQILTNLKIQTVKETSKKDASDDVASSTMSARSKVIRAEKAIQQILKSKYRSKLSISYLVYFFITSTLLLACLLWFSFNASAVSQRVDTVSEVLQDIYLRCFWTNLANQESRLWAGVRGGLINIPGIVDADIETETTNLTFHKVDEFNHKLWESVNRVDPEHQAMLEEKNVRVFGRDGNGDLEIISTENTFQVMIEIVSNGFKNVYKQPVDQPVENYIEKESRFIFDNSHNDLLIVSERFILIMKESVESTFEDSENINIIIFCLGIFFILLFNSISMGLLILINRRARQFMNILFTLPQTEAFQTELMLTTFQDILNKDYEGIECIAALDSVQVSHKVKPKQLQGSNSASHGESKKKKGAHLIRKLSTANVAKRNLFLFLNLLIAQSVILGCIIFYFSWSGERIHIMQRQQITINSALENINLQSMFSVQIQTLVMDNLTSTIRNIPVLQSLQQDLQKLTEIGTLEKKFRDQNGELPERLLEILINFNCSQAYSSLYLLPAETTIGECYAVSEKIGQAGLIKTILEMSFQLSSFLSKFQTSERDAETLKVLYGEVIETFIQYIDVATTLFLLAYDFTQNGFKELVEDLESKGFILAAIALGLVVVVQIWSWISSIRILLNREFEHKRVLAMVPTKLILENRHIKSYIITIISRNSELRRHFLH